jgi:hypothetical protein
MYLKWSTQLKQWGVTTMASDESCSQINSLIFCCVNSWEVIVVGIEHVAGDMFVSIPKGDAIFMKVRFIIIQFNTLSLRHRLMYGFVFHKSLITDV